jgi:hypothetical protein
MPSLIRHSAPWRTAELLSKHYDAEFVTNVGQVLEQKIFHILVDRPLVKERITTRLQRTFYEREFLKVVCCHSSKKRYRPPFA